MSNQNKYMYCIFKVNVCRGLENKIGLLQLAHIRKSDLFLKGSYLNAKFNSICSI